MSLVVLLSLLTIAVCAAVDWWVAWSSELAAIDERNPMAKWLLEKCGLACFLGFKVIGTLVVLVVIACLPVGIAEPVAIGVATVMLVVVGYLWLWS